MVTAEGADGVSRKVIYSKQRTDKPADEGYTREMYNSIVEEKYYDDLNSQPVIVGRERNQI